MATWKSLEQYAPFAQILVRYMWEARPPLNPNQLAIRAGVRRQVLSQWLNAPATAELHPDPAAVVKIARAMEVPVADLLIAAGHATEADPLLDSPGAWAYLFQRIEQSPPFAATDEHEGNQQDEALDKRSRERMLAFLHGLAAVDIATHRSNLASARQAESALRQIPIDMSADQPAEAPDTLTDDPADTADVADVADVADDSEVPSAT